MVPSGEGERKLETWKEIAAHLGKDVRTARRWESREGLPVHRHMHEAQGTIYAYPSELDDWLRGRSKQPSERTLSLEQSLPHAAEPLTPARNSRRDWYWGAGLAALLAVLVILGSAKARVKAVTPQARPFTASRFLLALARNAHGIRTVPLPSAPARSVLSTDGTRFFVALHERGSVAVIDLARGRLVKEFQTGGQPLSLALAGDGRTLYAGDRIDGLHIIDLETEKTRLKPTGGGAGDIILSPDGRNLYFEMGIHGLKRFDTKTGSLASVPAVVCPQTLSIGAATQTLWVSCRCGGPGGRPGHDSIDFGSCHGAEHTCAGRTADRGGKHPSVAG